MKKNILGSLSIILLLFMIGFILYEFKKNQNHFKQNYLVIKKERNDLEKKLNDLEQNYNNKFFNEKQNENFPFNKNLKLITINRDTVLANNVLKNKLVLRYNESNCRLCVDSEIDILIKNASLFTDEVCVVATYNKFRGIIVDKRKFVNNGLNNIKIYWVSSNLNIPLEKQNIPYYFYLNSNLTLNNVFIPMKEYPKLSQTYLKFALKNFFDKI